MHRLLPEKTDSAVLLLHGLGADGADLLGLGHEWRARFPTTAFFAPNAPQRCDMSPMGYQWFSLRDRTEAAMRDGVRAARPVADTLIDGILAETKLPASKLVLCGFSQGTMLSLYAGLRRAEPVAGIIGYSGALLGDAAEITATPPVLLTHGAEDTVVPVQASQHAAHQLEKAGVPVALHVIPRLGHGIDAACLDLGADFLHRVLDGF